MQSLNVIQQRVLRDFTRLVAFATQVVAGTNYCFLCTSTLVAPSQTQGAAKVYVFQPLPGQGEPYITQILPILP